MSQTSEEEVDVKVGQLWYDSYKKCYVIVESLEPQEPLSDGDVSPWDIYWCFLHVHPNSPKSYSRVGLSTGIFACQYMQRIA